MGSCLSKKSSNISSSPLKSASVSVPQQPVQPTTPPLQSSAAVDLKNRGGCAVESGKKKKATTTTTTTTMAMAETVEEEGTVKKEIFVIKHRKSHDTPRSDEDKSDPPQICNNNTVISGVAVAAAAAAPVRTSSCTKEEVDAILIQCGRLSRSSSGKAASGSGGGKLYSGSKRSYDFDNNNVDPIGDNNDDYVDDENDNGEKRSHRQRHRQSRASPSPQGRRRRTPSRERDQQLQRSGSRDRGGVTSGAGSERRVSRSPKRRSENTTNNSTNGAISSRPRKIVSVPATVSSSLVMDKSNNIEPITATTTTTAAAGSASIKRVSIKRNVGNEGGGRGIASPRSQSPAKAANQSNAVKVCNENQDAAPFQQQPSLSRSSSRKAEQSPFRRKPLNDISSNNLVTQAPPMVKPNLEEKMYSTTTTTTNNNSKVVTGNNRTTSRGTQENRVKEDHQHQNVVDETIEQPKGLQATKTNYIDTGIDNQSLMKPQTLTRSRSSRRGSHDLDHLNSELLLQNPPTAAAATSYASILLEDIQNFHQKNNNNNNNSNNSSFSLPTCLTKACSILEAVADLNSCNSGSNLSFEDSRDYHHNSSKTNNYDASYGTTNLVTSTKKDFEHPFVESELVVSDDLMEPSLHKYVTMRRGTLGGGGDQETDEQESSGSNSFIMGGSGGKQNRVGGGSSSSWEPNSADSTDCWTSRSKAREEHLSPLGNGSFQPGLDGEEAATAPRRVSAKKRDSSSQRTGIGRGRIGGSRGLADTHPTVAAAST